MHFDRFDVCAAYAKLEMDWNVGGWLRERPSNRRRRESIGVQLHRIGYRPPGGEILRGMNENARAIYHAAVRRLNLKG